MSSQSAHAETYFDEGAGIRSWLLTTDHKRIAWLYLVSLTGFFFLGGSFAVLIRIELATPAGDLVSDGVYNRLFSLHGIIMVWFFLVPSIPATLGNFLLPLMLGARDEAVEAYRSHANAFSTREVKNPRPSVPGPVRSSTACSGCGIRPTTLPRSLRTPAMSLSEPFGLTSL